MTYLREFDNIQSGKDSIQMPLAEKINRNQAIVALNLCGFNQREIGDLLGVDRRNVQMFLKKYQLRYFEIVIERLIKKLSSMVLKLKPTKKLPEIKEEVK